MQRPISPSNRDSCITDIEASYYETGPLLASKELAVKFINDCTQQCLEQQQFLFYDSVHPSEKFHQEFARSMLKKIQTQLLTNQLGATAK